MVPQGVATMILESPYYGSRRPPAQEGSKLHRVSDLLTLGRATIEESLYLLAWAQRQQYRHLGAPQRPFCTGWSSPPALAAVTVQCVRYIWPMLANCNVRDTLIAF